MPIVGLGLHFAVALFFAVHAVRTGQERYWLWILFSFPVLGSVVYFVTVYLPNSRLQRGVNKAAIAAVRILDPERELRDAEDAFDLSPSAQNRWRVASALLGLGRGSDAVEHFDALVNGPLGHDPELRLAAARARLSTGNAAAAAALAASIREARPEFRPEEVAIVLADALGAAGRRDEAQREYVDAVNRYGTVEARGAYAIWAASVGELGVAQRMRDDIEKSQRHWNRHAQQVNSDLIRRIDEALAQAQGVRT